MGETTMGVGESVRIPPPERLLDGRLKLRHLVLVTTIADAGSLARAAEQLCITQPVVTRGLQDLEAVLGVPLFVRSAQGVTVTPYGAAFVENARSILSQIRQAGRTLADLANAETGTVSVGTHLAGSNVLLPRAIGRLKGRRPGVVVCVREATPDVLEHSLLVGDLDLTVGRLTPADPRITQRRLYDEPIVLVVRADHPVLSAPSPHLRDLAALPWVTPVSGTALRRELESVFAAHAVPWPSNRVECTSVPTLRRLIIDGDFVAALPLLVAREDDRLAVLRTADDVLARLVRPVGISTVADRWTPPAVAALIDDLVATAQG